MSSILSFSDITDKAFLLQTSWDRLRVNGCLWLWFILMSWELKEQLIQILYSCNSNGYQTPPLADFNLWKMMYCCVLIGFLRKFGAASSSISNSNAPSQTQYIITATWQFCLFYKKYKSYCTPKKLFFGVFLKNFTVTEFLDYILRYF